MPWKPTKNYKKINGRFTMVRHTKWTIRMLKAEAKKYRTKEAFQKGRLIMNVVRK